jgi:hypothetical protein
MKGLEGEIEGIPAALCVRCKGAKLLCGKASCPIVTKLYLSSLIPGHIEGVAGNSPPSVFVGHNGYPRVRVGPSIPSDRGDTAIYDNPQEWANFSVEEIARLRFSLFRGYKVLRVDEASNPGRYLLDLHDMTVSSRPVPAEIEYAKFEGSVDYSPETQPFGPGGYLKRFTHSSSSSDPHIEKVYYDTDLNAKEAIVSLYKEENVYTIQKALSIGMIGKARFRRIVPTRWAITAVDKMLSDHFLSIVSRCEEVDSYLYFHSRRIGNEYYVLIFPDAYWFEMIEVWNNGSIWTLDRQPVIESDYEKMGRMISTPKIGGSFFAARLPVLEYLARKGRKGGILVVRFIDGDYTMPLGVWQVRENVRDALKKENNLESMEQFFSIIDVRRSLNLKGYSKTYLFRKNQKRITEFVS